MTASGIISTVQANWKAMLEACDAVKGTWSIYHDRLPTPTAYGPEYSAEERSEYLPFALVWTDPYQGYRLQAAGEVGEGGHYWEPSGQLVAEFYREAGDDESFRDWMGSLLNGSTEKPGLLQLVATAGYLAIKSVVVSGPLLQVPEAYPEFGALQTMMLVVTW